ncbi:hypothetical protein [Mucilaginibacter sp. OK283]|uniref:hypothetical protein n=1 Tax=Mucilaginibacter sp. OK283 TaxID=1881049 RepID=UPI0008B55EFA|nr:hypothetical protein [Mucilaginibacter sp. OK283]SEO79329.1 hypothetical protein SAMN05428947_104103 [Mucilaginibacter sp. OK283]
MSHKLKLKDINSTYGSHRKMSDRLVGAIPREILLGTDYLKMVYFALKEFNFAGSLELTEETIIRQRAVKILTRAGIYINLKIDSVRNGGSPIDPIPHFVANIIGFRKLPATILPEVEQNVRTNLQELDSLILKYEKNPHVTNFIATGQRRPTHESKIKIDFYQRCLGERDSINKYLVEELENRALLKALLSPGWDEQTGRWYESRWTKPYRYLQYDNIEYFDDEKIDVCRHRLMAAYTKDIPRMEATYASGNKAAFYEELRSMLPHSTVFEQLFNKYVPALPGIVHRLPAFNELKQLMDGGFWIAFTALALTQVEGIFSDILRIIKPNQNFSSLSTKALALRPHFNYETRNFDYFEYHLPRLRNSFLHSGATLGRDFKYIAYDLLYDLHYLLLVFDELEDPQLRLQNILRNEPIEKLTTLNHFNYLINLVASLRNRQKKHPGDTNLQQIMALWDQFEKKQLAPSGRLEYFSGIINSTFSPATKNMFKKIKSAAKETGEHLNIQLMSLKKLKTDIAHIQQVLGPKKFLFEEDYSELYKMKQFVETYKAHMPNCPLGINKSLDEFKVREKDNLAKLYLLKEVFDDD